MCPIELLHLSDSYCEKQLKKLCEKLLWQNVSVENVTSLIAVADKYKADVRLRFSVQFSAFFLSAYFSTSITPYNIFPYITDSWGYPRDGSSPTFFPVDSHGLLLQVCLPTHDTGDTIWWIFWARRNTGQAAGSESSRNGHLQDLSHLASIRVNIALQAEIFICFAVFVVAEKYVVVMMGFGCCCCSHIYWGFQCSSNFLYHFFHYLLYKIALIII